MIRSTHPVTELRKALMRRLSAMRRAFSTPVSAGMRERRTSTRRQGWRKPRPDRLRRLG